VPRWGMNPVTPSCHAVCVFALNPTSIIWFCWECMSPFGIVVCHRNRPLWCLWRTKFHSSKPSVLFSVCHSARLVSYFVTLYLCGYSLWYLIRRNSEDSEWNGSSKEEIVLPDHLCTSLSTKKSTKKWERLRLTVHENNMLAEFLLSPCRT
jgi:hypothetical protein